MRPIDADILPNRALITREEINKIPTMMIRPIVVGTWVKVKNAPNGKDLFECSQCGYTVDFGGYKFFNYCPDCGADLRRHRQKLD